MSVTRIHDVSISLDGFATGKPQPADAPCGHAGERLHDWTFRTRFWSAGGTAGVDDAFAERPSHGIGAKIMGASKLGPGWQDDPDRKGWWGPNPRFHAGSSPTVSSTTCTSSRCRSCSTRFRIWDGLDGLQDAYDVEAVSSPSGVTHLTFTRRVSS